MLSNSWGSSHQNTPLAWPDPMVQAAEAAVDAGVVGVWAQGNGGPATGTGNLPSSSDKVISVGAVSKYATIVQSTANVTGPAPVPAAPERRHGRRGLRPVDRGSTDRPAVGPAMVVARPESRPQKNLGCRSTTLPTALPEGRSPLGRSPGKIALIERGVCNFGDKVYNAQQAGAIGAVIYNPAGNETLITMGAGLFATAGHDHIRPHASNSNGLAMLNHYNANPGTATMEFFHNPHAATTRWVT